MPPEWAPCSVRPQPHGARLAAMALPPAIASAVRGALCTASSNLAHSIGETLAPDGLSPIYGTIGHI